MGAEPDRPSGTPSRRPAITRVAGAYTALVLAWVVLPVGSADQRLLLGDLAPLPLGLAAWGCARQAGQRSAGGPSSRSWSLIAAAFLLWWMGDLTWFVEEVLLHREPFPSAAEGFYLLSYPLLGWGLLSLPGVPRRRADRAKVALDSVTVLLAAAMAVWYLVVGPLVHGQPASLAAALSVAYPVGDLALLFAVAVVLLGSQRRQASLWLLLGGVGCLILADLAYARLSLTGAYAGGDWPDAGWALAQCLFVLAGARWTSADRQPEGLAHGGVSNLPYAAVVVGYGLLFAVGRERADYPLNGLLIGAAAITAVVMARQIRVSTENSRLLAKLQRLAAVDGLTSILNRRGFFEMGERLLTSAAGTQRRLTVLMIDVDNFKAVNDRLGHAAGDEVLVEVARRTVVELRKSDVIGRYGGDELGVVIPDCALAHGFEVAERIRRAVGSAAIVTADGAVQATLSIGVAEVQPGQSFSDALAQADAALYRAKDAGRGCTRAAAYEQAAQASRTP